MESNPNKVLGKSVKPTREILEAKKQYIPKMTNKLEDTLTSPKTYWTVKDYLLYNKKFLPYRYY